MVPGVKHGAILRRIQRAARAGSLLFGRHAREEMDKDGETAESVAAVLRRARTLAPQENGRWKVRGENLTVILDVSETVVYVLTVYIG